ncbi:MAG: hypothetical protein L0Y66_19875 [Myxococcaceae bacterium]|nr:hypothetical protein [Myxococcaceae bacterium]MCI0672009.1 hypothetical protein [Myxococcaceae bacterium]
MGARLRVLSVDGASSLDFDERVGYLRVGLVDAEAVETAQAKLENLGIPLDQVILQVEPPAIAWGQWAVRTRVLAA